MTEATKRERPTWLLPAAVGALAGLALGAGGVYALGGSDAGPDTSATLTLPETLDGLRVQSEVLAEMTDNEKFHETAQKREAVLQEATTKLSTAHAGAAVASQSYGDEDMVTSVTIYAVAAPRAGLWSSQDAESAPELLGMATAQAWVETEGDAECLVFPKEFLTASVDPAEVEPLVSQCQVVRDGVTVILEPNGQLSGDRGLELVQAAADELVVD